MIVIPYEKLQGIYKVAKNFVNDVLVEFTPEHMVLNLGDYENVTRCSIRLKREWFTKYDFTEHQIGVPLSKIEMYLKFADKKSDITFYMDTKTKGLVNVEFCNGDITYKAGFVKYVDGMLKQLTPVPEKTYIALGAKWNRYNIVAEDFAKVMNDMKMMYDSSEYISKSVKYTFTDNRFNISCTDDEIGYVNAEIDAYPQTVQENQKTVVSEYPTSKMKSMLDGLSLLDSEEIYFIMSIGNYVPLRYNFQIFNKQGDIDFLLAPRLPIGENADKNK